MSAGIFAIQEDGQLVEMTEEQYSSEDVLQTLLEQYPNLMAGDQINSDKPRRWLLIKREMGIPSEENGCDRWSIDHLFLDQDAVPTLVEVKRSTDTRIRREVVGQMLDYAANGVVYWPAEKIRSYFEDTCQELGEEPEQYLLEFLQKAYEPEQFWQLVKTNLKAGKLRLIFVADKIPTELKRIVEFLNEQMDPAEVLAIEIKQYVGQGLKTLVPKVIGQTVEAQTNKAVAQREKRQWDESSFLENQLTKRGPAAVKVSQQILAWAQQAGLTTKWGNGAQWGSFQVIVNHHQHQYRLFAVWTTAYLETYFKYIRRYPPFDDQTIFSELLERLYSIEGVEAVKDEWRETYYKVRFDQLQQPPRLESLLAFYGWVIAKILES